ncbi:MAG: circadian clock protein KaiB [Syntrophobacteraceae bacterium]
MSKYVLRLYITGHTPRSLRAIENLRSICERELESECDIKIIDALENPQLANEDKVLATPTLIKVLPLPTRRIIGDLSDTKTVLLGLDIHSLEYAATKGREQ